jgi:hypothetical protein
MRYPVDVGKSEWPGIAGPLAVLCSGRGRGLRVIWSR